MATLGNLSWRKILVYFSVRLHSTKLLCGILLSGVINIANATTSTQEIPIVVTVSPMCT